MTDQTREITELIRKVRRRARERSGKGDSTPHTGPIRWPVECTIGPGLEGAIACETKVSYINGAQGAVIYQGYDVFDLCARACFEEVCYLLLNGRLPTKPQLDTFNQKLVAYRSIPHTLRALMNFSLEEMHTMAALRLGSNLMRQRLTWRDRDSARPEPESAIAADEDSIAMETKPMGEKRAIYEFGRKRPKPPEDAEKITDDAAGMESCLHLISGLATLTAAIHRLREDKLPIDPDPELGHAANFLYMMTGRRPTPEEERVMDVSLILHADHGMNASTFAALVVASTLSDIYFSIGSGIAALSGPLHGGANEQVLKVLEEIGSPSRVAAWYERARRQKRLIPGFGHRVYKTYDPRALVLAPLVRHLVKKNPDIRPLYSTAQRLEKVVVSTLGKQKAVYPNVDFYSGLVYRCMGIPAEMFTPIFAVSRVAGWTARVLEYLRKNRIFRPRSVYTGEFGREFVPIGQR